MKKIKYLIPILLLSVIFFSSCTKDFMKPFSSTSVNQAGALTLAVHVYDDTNVTVTYNFASAGRVALVIFEAANVTADDTTLENLSARTSPNASDKAFLVTTGSEGTYDFKGLKDYTDYVVYGVASNADGSFSKIAVTNVFQTNDHNAPYLVSTTPERAQKNVWILAPIVLTFSEPVTVDTSKLYVTDFSGGNARVKITNVAYSGNNVILYHDSLRFNHNIFINADSAAFKDASGNGANAIITVNGVELDFYYKTSPNPTTMLDSIYTHFAGVDTLYELDPADSATLWWTSVSNISIEKGANVGEYTVTDDNFWDAGSSVTFTFYTNGKVSLPYQIFYTSSTGNVYSAEGYSPSGDAPYGHWYYTDFSFDIVANVYKNGVLYDQGYFYYMPAPSKKGGFTKGVILKNHKLD